MKTQGADDSPKGPELVGLAEPVEPAESVMRWLHFDVQVGVLQVDTGQPLVELHNCDDGLQCLNLERDLVYFVVEEV